MAVERLLLESGDYLLLETGDRLLLESSTGGGSTDYVITPSGGVIISGVGVYIQSKTITPNGGISISGSSIILKTKVVSPTNGVILGGTGNMTSNTTVVSSIVGERTKVGAGT